MKTLPRIAVKRVSDLSSGELITIPFGDGSTRIGIYSKTHLTEHPDLRITIVLGPLHGTSEWPVFSANFLRPEEEVVSHGTDYILRLDPLGKVEQSFPQFDAAAPVYLCGDEILLPATGMDRFNAPGPLYFNFTTLQTAEDRKRGFAFYGWQIEVPWDDTEDSSTLVLVRSPAVARQAVTCSPELSSL